MDEWGRSHACPSALLVLAQSEGADEHACGRPSIGASGGRSGKACGVCGRSCAGGPGPLGARCCGALRPRPLAAEAAASMQRGGRRRRRARVAPRAVAGRRVAAALGQRPVSGAGSQGQATRAAGDMADCHLQECHYTWTSGSNFVPSDRGFMFSAVSTQSRAICSQGWEQVPPGAIPAASPCTAERGVARLAPRAA